MKSDGTKSGWLLALRYQRGGFSKTRPKEIAATSCGSQRSARLFDRFQPDRRYAKGPRFEDSPNLEEAQAKHRPGTGAGVRRQSITEIPVVETRYRDAGRHFHPAEIGRAALPPQHLSRFSVIGFTGWLTLELEGCEKAKVALAIRPGSVGLSLRRGRAAHYVLRSQV
jgi:hypothetical protein